jgi:hypothetical protein
MQGVVSCELLTIKGHRDDHSIRDMSLWGGYLDLPILDLVFSWFLSKRSVSNGHVASSLLRETRTQYLRYSASTDGPEVRGHSLDGWVDIVHEMLLRGDDLSAIQSDRDIEPRGIIAMIKSCL